MKHPTRNIIWLIVISAVVFCGMQYTKSRFSEKGIKFSYFASDEFKNRITYTLDFIKKNYPEEYQLIQSNVRLIKEPNSKAYVSRGPSSSSYAAIGREEENTEYGLISLLPVPGHCPPSLIKDKSQLINCAGVIYHEALHHYHSNNKLYEGNPSLEHYHVYKRQYEFVIKMGANKQNSEFLRQRMNDFYKGSHPASAK